MSLCEVHTSKIDMFRYGRFKNIASIARTLEFFFAVMFLSRLISFSSAYFPAVVEFCRFFFRRLCMVLVSHRFVFFLGNLIVITLFVKSSHSAGDNRCGSSDAGSSDDEEEYLIGQFVTPNVMVSWDVASEETASVEKHMIPTEVEVPLASGRRNPEPRRRRRTRSEDFGAKVTEKIQLRRSETEVDLKTDRSGEKSAGRRMNVEDLSNEEFQRKVEEFIVRQQMFLREESLYMANRKSFSA